MFEKVNPAHPDKIADRIAGAIVDLAYYKYGDPKIAVEVLIGHGICTIIIETSVELSEDTIKRQVKRISQDDNIVVNIIKVPQDYHLSQNQSNGVHCGDNGIFKGVPVSDEERYLTQVAKELYGKYGTDGKYIYDKRTDQLIICQSCADYEELKEKFPDAVINPIGDWVGGLSVDSGATNRKLGSDMGGSITGGGLHGKDLSKADVSVNIYLWLKAQELGHPCEAYCAIGSDMINGVPYSEIVDKAKEYIQGLGGFENFAMWGLIR